MILSDHVACLTTTIVCIQAIRMLFLGIVLGCLIIKAFHSFFGLCQGDAHDADLNHSKMMMMMLVAMN